MIIYFVKDGDRKGEIVASFPEIYAQPDINISIKEDGVEVLNSGDLEVACLMPLDAQDYEDPTNVKNIHRCNVIDNPKDNSTKIVRYVKENKDESVAIKIENMDGVVEAWNDLAAYAKIEHPGMGLREAINKTIV